MVVLLYIIIFCLDVYGIAVIILFITELVGKKKLPWVLVITELICIGLFFLLEYLIVSYKIVFIGGYSERDNWGAGLNNVMSVIYNLWILIGGFILTQLFIGATFSKEFKKLTNKDHKWKVAGDFPGRNGG